MIWTAFTVLLLAAVYTDARIYKIPNWISLSLVGPFVAAVLAALLRGIPVMTFWPNIVIGGAMLGLCYLLYLYTSLGAGDAKLAAAASLWTGFYGLYMWTFWLGVAMALIAIVLVILRRVVP